MHHAFMSCLDKWLPDGDASYFEFRDFIHDRYGLWTDEYFARDLHEDWNSWFSKEQVEWMAKMRVAYREQLQKMR